MNTSLEEIEAENARLRSEVDSLRTRELDYRAALDVKAAELAAAQDEAREAGFIALLGVYVRPQGQGQRLAA